MDLAVPPELEELILCSCCHLPFNDTDALPKLFTCRHYFCLKCANTTLQKGSELYCVHCWKRTELSGPDMTPDNLPTYGAILYLTQNLSILCANSKSSSGKQRSSSTSSVNSNNGGNSGGASCNSTASGSSNSISETTIVQTNIIQKGENCMTHAMPNTSWCANCIMLVCRACAASEDHRNHVVKSHVEVNETIQADIANELHSMQKTLNDVQYLVVKQREFLLKILESCTTMKTQIETELLNQLNNKEISDMRESLCRTRICLDMFERQSPTELLKLYTTLHMEKQRLNSRYEEIYLQCKLDDLIRNYGMVFDFDIIKQALNQIHNCVYNGGNLDAFAGLNGTATHHSPILLLANYCISQLYTRHVVAVKQQYQSIFNSNSSGYYQLQQHLLQLSHNQPQAIVPPQASLSSQPSPHDGVIQVKTYADITTMSPKSNQQHHHPSNNPTSSNGFGNRLTESPGSGGSGMGPVAPPSGVRIPPPPPGGAFASNDFSSLSVPALNMIQHMQKKQHSNQVQKSNGQQQQGNAAANLLCNPSVHVYPIYYFNIDMNGQNIGRILIEVRNDVAPKMAKNFGALVTHELGFGYKGCQIFQCWENESIITGDFELNNGRGGRSVFEENYFMPDDTKILAIRGSVGMRRSQKRHDNMGLVGSQFRVILREMRGFTGIFAFVVDGLDLVEKISQAGDSAGKPQSNVVIQNCGKYQ